MKLPNRVFNSPLIEFVNFKDGTHLNLIRLIKPYANGYSFAIYSTSNQINSKLFVSGKKAKDTFDKAVKLVTANTGIVNSGQTRN